MIHDKIVKRLPKLLVTHFSEPILNQHSVCAIGYGSGVFPQSSQSSNNTVDVMLIVKDSVQFHREMIRCQPKDYGGLARILGSSYLSLLNNYIFPAHFNHVQVEGTKLKYAVIDLKTILSDLRSWKLLTFAGRLHKPVLFNIMNRPQPQQLLDCMRNNHKMVLNVGLLNMIGKVRDNEVVPIQNLYKRISNVSYAGDIRHTMAVENSNKVDNIVNNNRLAFDSIYQPLLRQLSTGLSKGTLNLEEQNKIKLRFTPELINRIFQHDPFPEVLRQHFLSINQHQTYKNITQKVLLNGVNQIPTQIQQRLSKINRNSSIRMAAENFFGASLLHNMKYILAKIKKRSLK